MTFLIYQADDPPTLARGREIGQARRIGCLQRLCRGGVFRPGPPLRITKASPKANGTPRGAVEKSKIRVSGANRQAQASRGFTRGSVVRIIEPAP